MCMGFIDRVTLRGIISIASVFSLIFIVVYIVITSANDIRITGSIDIGQIITVFLTLIGVVIGWLFGREQRRS